MKARKVFNAFCSLLIATNVVLMALPNTASADGSNLLINDTFDDSSLSSSPFSTGTLDGYKVSTPSNNPNPPLVYAQIVSDPAQSENKMLELSDSSNSTNGNQGITVSKNLPSAPTSGLLDAEFDFMDTASPNGGGAKALSFRSGSNWIVELYTANVNGTLSLCLRDGSTYLPIIPFQSGDRYHISMQLDLSAQTADVTITNTTSNKTGSLTGQEFENPLTSSGVTSYWMNTSGGGLNQLYYDNIQMFVPTIAPSAPSDLTAKTGNTQVALSWNAARGASSYNLYRSSTAGGAYSSVQENINDLSFTDRGLTNDTTYYYVVTGVNPNGEGPKSNEVSVTPNDSVPLPAAPSGLTLVPRDTEVSVSWNDVPGASGYILKRSTTSGGPYTTIEQGLTSTTFLDRTVTNNTTYYYIVAATSVGGTGHASNEAKVTPASALQAPTGVRAVPGNNKVDLNWSSVPSADHYNVLRSSKNGGRPFQ